MAAKIKAINAFRPRIKQGTTVQKAELIRRLARATSLVEGSVELAMKELRDQLIDQLRLGRAVKVDGLGTWTPTIGLDGTVSIQYLPDSLLNHALNEPGMFAGLILNPENIGKTSQDLIAMWNEANPGDLVEGSPQ